MKYPEVGEIWIVQMPDKKEELFLIWQEAHSSGGELYVRGIPISSWQLPGDPTEWKYECWLEGPILMDCLVRGVKGLPHYVMKIVSIIISQNLFTVPAGYVQDLLINRFDGVYQQTWKRWEELGVPYDP